MMFMNEYEIEELAVAWRQHPIMGPAAHSLKNLMEWANANSDGWHSWPKPCRAAKQLQELLQGYVAEGGDRCPECQAGGVSGYHRRYCSRPDVTREAVRKAYKPIKAFRTRMTAAGMPWFTVEDV